MSDYFGFPNMANVPNPSEWKHADTAKDWAEKANDSATLAKNYAEQVVENVSVVNEHVQRMDEHITEVTAEVLTAAQTATTKATQAATSEANASASATSASISATSASTSASNAADSATAANTYKNTAQSAATDATTAKTAAQTAATTATTKAAEAASSAIDAATAKSYAQQIADSVEEYVDEAETYATNAQTYANAAGTHADEAETSAQLADAKATAATASANAAAASVTQAQQVVSTASAYAAQAQTQATNAATSATAAATSATSAATSATSASESADDAAESATAAAASAETASGAVASVTASATAAATSATSASNSATTANTFMTSAATSASEAAASAASAAQSAATCDTDEFTPTGEYNNNGPGRNRKLIDTIGVTEEAAVPDTHISSIDNFCNISGPYLTSFSASEAKAAFNGSLITFSTSYSDSVNTASFVFCAKSTSTTIYRTTDIKDIAFKFWYAQYFNPSTLLSVDIYDTPSGTGTSLASGVDYDMQLAPDGKYILYIKASLTAQKITISFSDEGHYFSTIIGRIVTKTKYGSKASVKLGNANSMLDVYGARIKHDHRVRVHINLPFRDHMDDNDGFDHYGGSFGFSGGNFCPDSDIQYYGANRYKYFDDVHRLGNVGVSGKLYTNSDYPNTINTSPGKTSFTNTTHIPTYGRLHTGWCSWALNPILGCNALTYNYTYDKVAVSRPFSKLYVPATWDINEDTTSLISTLDRSMAYGNNLYNGRADTYNFNSVYYPCYMIDNKEHNNSESNVMRYVIPANFTHIAGSTTTNVTNPRAVVYAGATFGLPTPYGSSSSTKGVYSLKDATYGLCRNSVNNYPVYFSNVDSGMDNMSLIGPNDWHSNPILPDVSGNSYFSDDAPMSFLDRFSTISMTGRGYGSAHYNMGETLGIRYFDAEAQEWRVFSPGDNCSYGYDGTHWNYREYLWVDLDKPVTYIVGGLTDAGFNTDHKWQIDWSTFAALDGGSYKSGTCSPYMVESYCPDTNCGVRYYKPSANWDQSGVTKTNDLIHVETPNFDNYTSYSSWRGLTLMTVDYSSSPLNANNTVYCADSAYGAEDSGTLDLTKVSCMYSVDPTASSIISVNNIDNNVVKSAVTTEGTNCYMYPGVSTNSPYSNPISKDNKLIIKNNSSPFTTSNYQSTHMEHTCYHIRIGLES